ncbi:hypothetical protein [Microvirga antarctica]|uniref:hypothetical protein n=1 Tax=Microvirga antarctica TaxID=2819233 RepID=UPI001B314F8D|nr:hypothetical protein [Microvirga antarctica]
MSQPTDTFKRAKPRQRTAPAKRVILSAEDRKAYEELAKARDERERNYTFHLPADMKNR